MEGPEFRFRDVEMAEEIARGHHGRVDCVTAKEHTAGVEMDAQARMADFGDHPDHVVCHGKEVAAIRRRHRLQPQGKPELGNGVSQPGEPVVAEFPSCLGRQLATQTVTWRAEDTDSRSKCRTNLSHSPHVHQHRFEGGLPAEQVQALRAEQYRLERRHEEVRIGKPHAIVSKTRRRPVGPGRKTGRRDLQAVDAEGPQAFEVGRSDAGGDGEVGYREPHHCRVLSAAMKRPSSSITVSDRRW